MAKVEYETRGRVGIFTLNRPEARNAVNGEVAADFEAALDRFEEDPEVWVGVITATLTGDRPVFSAGADLKAVNTAAGAGISTQKGGFAGFAYREREKPVIAAVDGLATAGGCEIVLACDLVVASTRSSFGLAEVKRNLVAGAGGLFRLPRAIGRAAAMEAILTGEPISAQRAYELGLVSRLCEPEQSLDTAIALAEQICLSAPMAVRESRKVVLAADYADDETLKKMTNAAMAKIMSSEDLQRRARGVCREAAAQLEGSLSTYRGPSTPRSRRKSREPVHEGVAVERADRHPLSLVGVVAGDRAPPRPRPRSRGSRSGGRRRSAPPSPTNAPHVPSRPVSSRSSRTTASASVSPGSTRPPGTRPQARVRARCRAAPSSSRRHAVGDGTDAELGATHQVAVERAVHDDGACRRDRSVSKKFFVSRLPGSARRVDADAAPLRGTTPRPHPSAPRRRPTSRASGST